jgi:hypothetical protein
MPRVFTYGPDALQGKMYDRIGPTEFIGGAVLADHRLVFDKPNLKNAQEGLANLQPAEGEQVFGAVFELSARQVELLDGFFGGYEQRTIKVHSGPDLDDSMRVTAWFARRTKKGVSPSGAVLAASRQAMEENGAAAGFIEALDRWVPLPGTEVTPADEEPPAEEASTT